MVVSCTDMDLENQKGLMCCPQARFIEDGFGWLLSMVSQ